ncbi:MAG: response regulator transcription factor [Bacteroidales bacterium]|nr:response regulator transcription factor [Bacteroidales bacterium]
MIRTVVIDDEIRARESIIELLKLFKNEIEVVGTAHDVQSGLKAIDQHKPDLVLLDIIMPDGTGFDLLKQIKSINFKLIFITAYEQYAIKAFKFSAIDYLLKPIDPDDFQEALLKLEKTQEKNDIEVRLNTFRDHMDDPSSKNNRRVVLKTSTAIHVVEIDDIIRCESDRNYTSFSIVGLGNILVSRTIKDFADILEEFNFFRAHQSHLINLDHLRKYDKENFVCVMSDQSEIPVSHRRKDLLFKKFRSA